MDTNLKHFDNKDLFERKIFAMADDSNKEWMYPERIDERYISFMATNKKTFRIYDYLLSEELTVYLL